MSRKINVGLRRLTVRRGGKTRGFRSVAAVALVLLTLLPIAVVSGALATPPSEVTATLLGKARFDEIDAKTKTRIDANTCQVGFDQRPQRQLDACRGRFWRARINTNGSSDVEVLEVKIAPGGTFGWHSHPGPSLVIVKSGTATFYMADDPSCTPHVVPTGSGFVDNGGDVHTVRNEGSVELVNIVSSLIPAGATRRIDEPSPGNCPF
jgi:quercetin dioxygenase-like cupin family protein